MDEQTASFTPGQRVVWHYRPQHCRWQTYWVDAEVVQFGPIRTRIRVTTSTGGTLLRWVHPKNLRVKEAHEPAYPFPKADTSCGQTR